MNLTKVFISDSDRGTYYENCKNPQCSPPDCADCGFGGFGDYSADRDALIGPRLSRLRVHPRFLVIDKPKSVLGAGWFL